MHFFCCTSCQEAGATELTCLAFGPAQSYIVIPHSDSFRVFWKSGLADSLRKSDVEHLAFEGTDGYYVRYSDGNAAWKLHPDLGKLIKREGVKWIAFGSEGYIFMSESGGLRWWNIPDELEQLLESDETLVSVAVGQGSAYVAIFEKEYMWGGDVPRPLEKMLRTKTVPGTKQKINSFDAVWLSAYDDRYFLQYNGGATQWNSVDTYFDTMMSCDKMVNPL